MNRLSSIFGAIAVIAIAVVFIVSFQPGRGQNQVQTGPECATLGTCIRGTHFWASYRLIVPRGANDQFVKSLRLKETVLNGLIERELLNDDAKRLGIGVSEDDLSKELVNGRIHVSLQASRSAATSASLQMREEGVVQVSFIDKKTNAFSADAYRKLVTEITHLSETDFRDHQRAELIAARMRDLVRSRVHIAESEAKDRYMRHNASASVTYVKIEKRWVARHLLDKTDKAIAAWADKNKEEVDKLFESRKANYAGECRVARNIFIRLDPASPTADDDKKKAHEKLEETKKKIDGGASFEDLAKLLTEDNTNEQGGDLGCVLKGQMPKPFEDQLYGMKEGEISPIVETQLGVHLIKLVKVAKGDEAIKIGRETTAKQAYGGYESERLASEAAKEILANAKGGKTLQVALKEYLDKVQPQAAPSKDKDGDKPAGDKEKSPKDGKAKEPNKDPKATDGKDPKATEPAKGDGADAKEDDEDAPTVMTSASFKISGQVFAGVAEDTDAAAMAFALKKPLDVPANVIPLERGEGYAVMQLKERTDPGDKEWADARDFEMWQVRNFKEDDALNAYVKSLTIAAGGTIKVNPAFAPELAEKKPGAAKPGDKKDESPQPAPAPPMPDQE